MSAPRSRIAVSLNCGWTIRNWIYTGIMKELCERYDILVLSPVADSPAFRAMAARQGLRARFAAMPGGRRRNASSAPGKLKNVIFNADRRIETFRIRLGERKGRPRMAALLRNLHRVPGIMGVARAAGALEGALESDPGQSALLREFRPELLVSTHPFAAADIGLLRAARRARIPVLASILSWDNLTTKGMLPIRFDKVLLWSPAQAEQFLGYYPRYRRSQIALTGIPQFDLYAASEPAAAQRDELARLLGIPPSSPILLYCTSAEILAPHEPEIVASVAAWIGESGLPGDVHLLIRCHPHDRPERYRHLQVPGKVSVFASGGGAVRDPYTWIPPDNEITLLSAMLKSSSVCLNIASTTSIDAAACGVPVVNIGYDGDPAVDPGRSVRRFYEFTHYRDVVRTGGVRIAWNPGELLDGIRAYLANPALDADKRARLVEEQCWKLDGRSSARVVEAVERFRDEIKR